MESFIATIGILIFFIVLYLLQDTITEFLCKGKSFAPNETKW
jgi:hypothetical protein